MIDRRKFIEKVMAAGALTMVPNIVKSQTPHVNNGENNKKLPVIISTWKHGLAANNVAMKTLTNNGSILDAVENGVMVPEGDPNNHSVGIGGLPDRDGFVTLDASIMDSNGNAGAVCFLENIVHPISVARMVMEKTPHVMLSGEGALKFALENGFEEQNLLTPEAKKIWEKQMILKNYQPNPNWENNPNKFHDTIGLLGIDENGDIAGACTTSGMAFKIRGRVGDSPIIGAGLFVDNEIGAATSTGMGELVMKTVGSFLVVELMRNGMSPQQAVEEAVKRIVKKVPDHKKYQVGYIAVNKQGETGAYCLLPGFNYALYQNGINEMHDSNSYYK